MEKRFNAGPDATLVVDESERARWEAVGITDQAVQDKIFSQMAHAVAELTAIDDADWQPAESLLADTQELGSTRDT